MSDTYILGPGRLAIGDGTIVHGRLSIERGKIAGVLPEDGPSDIALPAYISSFYAASDLVQQVLPEINYDGVLTEAVALWCASTPTTPPGEADRKKQKAWDEPRTNQTISRLIGSADDVNRARLLSVTTRIRTLVECDSSLNCRKPFGRRLFTPFCRHPLGNRCL